MASSLSFLGINKGASHLEIDISKPVASAELHEKAAGKAQFIGDLKLDGLLYAKTLRSERPRARLVSVHIPPLPEGYFIVDHNDVPGHNRVRQILDDQPFFAETQVNYIGEPILLVVGPEKTEILRLLQEISVEYEDIAPILSLDDVENDSLAPIFSGGKYFSDYHYGRGDVDACFENAVTIYEGSYETGHQVQMYIEPQGVLAVYEKDRMTVYGSLQCPYYVKNAVVAGLGWDKDRVQIVQTTVGGAFGGKEDYPSLLAGQAAFAALKTGKPVQIILDRAEDIEVTPKRHPSMIHLRTALDENNQITAMVADVRTNAGAYAGLSTVVLQRMIFHITGAYNIPSLAVRGRTVATNTVPSGAFRGFGSPQAIFAIEMHMNAIARKIGADPLDFKMRHMVKTGDPTSTGGTFRQSVILPALIDAVVSQSDYRRKTIEYSSNRSPSFRGIGISLFLHGGAFTGSGERDHIKAEAKLRKMADGRVEILTAAVDMGQGPRTTFRKIVAKALDIPIERIICDKADTDRVPDSGPTVASRSIIIVGKLLHDAALELKQVWNDKDVIEVIQHYRHPDFAHWEDTGGNFFGDAYPSYSWGVNAVEVEVDPTTFEITVKGAWSAFDVGKAIDERVIRGQIEGGIVQGLGFGSIELVECRNGKIQQRSMADCIIPSSLDFGPIKSLTIDNLYEEGPFGAKGAGELTIVGAAPALAIAIGNALELDINRLPVTPEYLMEVLES